MTVNDVITSVLSVIVGIITGFYFERRPTRATRMQNDDLRRQVRELGEMVLSLGAGHARVPSQAHATGDLPTEMLQWARQAQDPSGKVVRARLVERFVENGSDRTDVDDALEQLRVAGLVRLKERMVEIT